MEILIEHGFDGMEQVMAIMVNEAMKIERANALRAAPYERTPARMGRANGYKTKNVKSRLGNLAPAFPQGRDGIKFYPSALENDDRSLPIVCAIGGSGLATKQQIADKQWSMITQHVKDALAKVASVG